MPLPNAFYGIVNSLRAKHGGGSGSSLGRGLSSVLRLGRGFRLRLQKPFKRCALSSGAQAIDGTGQGQRRSLLLGRELLNDR